MKANRIKSISSYPLFNLFTRKELRRVAKKFGIRRGKNKSHTIYNLMEAGVTIGIEKKHIALIYHKEDKGG